MKKIKNPALVGCFAGTTKDEAVPKEVRKRYEKAVTLIYNEVAENIKAKK